MLEHKNQHCEQFSKGGKQMSKPPAVLIPSWMDGRMAWALTINTPCMIAVLVE